MMRRLLIILFFIIFVFSSTYFIANFTYSKEQEQKKIEYNLPYPGILPDNPLYPIKNIRDKLLVFFTRDNLKKIELFLLLSDKKIYMSRSLINVGKWELSVKTAHEAEEVFLKIPPLITTSKKQGVGAGEDLIKRLKQSSLKHQELINDFLKKVPKEYKEELKKTFKINEKILKEISRL